MWNWINQLEQFKKESRPVSIVTVAGVEGSAPREVGAKMLVLQDGTFFGTIGGGNVELLAIEEAKRLLMCGTSEKVRFPLGAKAGQCCGGVIELLFETINTGPQLYVFGAGHVGQALSRAMNDSVFTVHLIDEREDWIAQAPRGVISHCIDPETFILKNKFSATQSFCVVMTHQHQLDESIIQLLLDKPHRYLGLIGSSAKWSRFQQRMSARGIPENKFKDIKCPIGIANLGKSPPEIAISVGAELLQIHYA